MKRKTSNASLDNNEEKDEKESAVSISTSMKSSHSQKKSRNEVFPGGGRRGVSSGLSVVKKRLKGGKNGTMSKPTTSPANSGGGEKWWKTL